MIQKLIEASIRNRVLVVILFVLVALLSIFSLKTARIDAIPDIGENQQIVFTEWPGRSPKDIEEQVTYPLSIMLQGIPGVKNIRGISAFGFSTIYVIFKDDVDFYWSRSRVLEKLSTAGSELPSGVVPQMGPDATGLGQIYWYTIENEERKYPSIEFRNRYSKCSSSFCDPNVELSQGYGLNGELVTFALWSALRWEFYLFYFLIFLREEEKF